MAAGILTTDLFSPKQLSLAHINYLLTTLTPELQGGVRGADGRSTIGTGSFDLVGLKQIAHHKDGNHQSQSEQRNSENQTHAGSLAQRQTDNQSGDEQDQADGYAERKSVS